MSDLELNIALAEAMGWTKLQMDYFGNPSQMLVPEHRGELRCYDSDLGAWRKFDYRDPVIFTAICKRWNVGVIKVGRHGYAGSPDSDELYGAMKPEYAAAWCVIESVKRGAK